MSEFSQVTVVREANIFFNGGVTSRTVLFADGTKKTLGIMQPGEYEFNTSSGELMEILAGDLDVQLPGTDAWQTFAGGQAFEVGAGERFGLRVRSVTDYCCSFLP
ncbi:pyrimidine/purine nucleoside phosphorylase [uncultured Thiodictyon sp.]|uniref:pyrimidine/purine nucleoside phosphorylase n=1 Tax=uncultured Thiodictyon sp. TaxID=1846217 RepID=UPI0025FBE55F|nr:pyrimidine/purine nucleoside phosphorylase [uncultured Thiodictyon sp.]